MYEAHSTQHQHMISTSCGCLVLLARHLKCTSLSMLCKGQAVAWDNVKIVVVAAAVATTTPELAVFHQDMLILSCIPPCTPTCQSSCSNFFSDLLRLNTPKMRLRPLLNSLQLTNNRPAAANRLAMLLLACKHPVHQAQHCNDSMAGSME